MGPKLPVANASVATSVLKYSENDLQRNFKAVLEARALVPALALVPAPAPVLTPAPVPAPIPAPALAPIVAEASREKLKARSLDVYHRKSHIDYYNFCQQYEDYFATARATGSTRIFFATSFLRDQISFCWQQYKRRHDAETPVWVTWDEFKAFLHCSLGDSQAFVDTYWGKLKRDSQYQQEEFLDWAAYLKHLQAVLQEFDPGAAPNERIMIRCFLEDLKPSIRAQIDAQSRDLNS